MKLLFKCILPGRVAIKKNGTRRHYSYKLRRTITVPSLRYSEWETAQIQYLKSIYAGAPIDCLMRATFKFYFRNHQAEPDLSNCYEGPQDVLQKAGVIVDDKFIMSHDGSRKYFGFEPRVEISLYEFEE